MGLSYRHYLFEENGRLRRIPKRVSEAMAFGNDALPEYASTQQKVCEVLVESEDRKPIRILDAIGTFWRFDADGKIDQALRDSMADWMNLAFQREQPRKGPVVDLMPEIKKRKVHEKHRWLITKEDLDRVAADIWPGINGPAPDVTTVKGTAPKKPPVPWSAINALAEIESKINSIKFDLERLTEPALRGLEWEAQRTATFEDTALWRGVAEEAKRQREVLAAHRTGKGEWFAVIEAFRSDGPHSMKVVATAHEKCASHVEAIAAGKRLMAEKADWLGPEIRIDIMIYSALEWQPEDE